MQCEGMKWCCALRLRVVLNVLSRRAVTRARVDSSEIAEPTSTSLFPGRGRYASSDPIRVKGRSRSWRALKFAACCSRILNFLFNIHKGRASHQDPNTTSSTRTRPPPSEYTRDDTPNICPPGEIDAPRPMPCDHWRKPIRASSPTVYRTTSRVGRGHGLSYRLFGGGGW